MTLTGAWLADVCLCLLLIGTLLMSVRLDRALRLVRRDRSAFETLIGSLGSATQAVSLGVERLRSEADRAAELIERRSEEADRLATDLSFLIDRAERSGRRLEETLMEGSEIGPVGTTSAEIAAVETPPTIAEHSLATVAAMVRSLASAKGGKRS